MPLPLSALAIPDSRIAVTDPTFDRARRTFPRIAVVGGGITGLAAAHRLTELLPRVELTLFEAAPRLGGVIESARGEGFLIERSADNFLTKLPAAVDLCRRVGLADELLPTDDTRRRAFVVRDGRLVLIPEGFFLMSPRRLWPILASPVLSLPAKLRLLAEPFVSRPRPSASASGLGEGADESVASFVRRRLGREAFERLVQPLVAGIYTADPEKLSMAATMPEFLAMERERGRLLQIRFPSGGLAADASNAASGARYSLFVAPRQGMSALVAALADRLSTAAIRLNTAVASIQQAESNWQLDLDPEHPECSQDAVVVALPAHAAACLLEGHDRELSAELASIEYAGCAVVSLGFTRDQIAHPLDGFGFVVPQIEKRQIIAASFASQKFPGRAPTDAVLIRTFLGGALAPELLKRSDAELCRLAIDELRELLHITGEPTMTDVARWPRSMPQYHVGHMERVARIEQLAARHPTLALAGNAYHGVGIPQCIASAEAAAERIAARFAGPAG